HRPGGDHHGLGGNVTRCRRRDAAPGLSAGRRKPALGAEEPLEDLRARALLEDALPQPEGAARRRLEIPVRRGRRLPVQPREGSARARKLCQARSEAPRRDARALPRLGRGAAEASGRDVFHSGHEGRPPHTLQLGAGQSQLTLRNSPCGSSWPSTDNRLYGKFIVFRFSWKWRKRSPIKIMERTHEEATEELHAGRESRHPEAASDGAGADLGAA